MEESKDELIERLTQERKAWTELAKRQQKLLQHRMQNVEVASESKTLQSRLEEHWKTLKKDRLANPKR
eukprot:UN02983